MTSVPVPRGDACSLQLFEMHGRGDGVRAGPRDAETVQRVDVRVYDPHARVCPPSSALGNSHKNGGKEQRCRVSLSYELGSRGKGRETTSWAPSTFTRSACRCGGESASGWCFGVRRPFPG